MESLFDEFSKSLAEESLPRRESLRRLGAVFAGAVLGPLGFGTTWAGPQDPCKAFCKCSNAKQQNQCLTACRQCGMSRLAGACGNYTCCPVAACNGVCSKLKSDPNCGACGNDCRAFGQTCCGGHCADLKNDLNNCGGCGQMCEAPGLNEYGACVAGTCVYDCVDEATDCNGACTFLDSDPDNCGACGNVCPAQAPNCSGGICHDSTCRGYCPEGWCGGDGCGGECGCPIGMYCEYNGWCYPGCDPNSPYYPNC